MKESELFCSVIICTNNPSYDYLNRVIDALKKQTLQIENWEFIVVDNASNNDVISNFNFKWHPNYRYIFEEQLGLTLARLRGIKESKSNLLVFVDDDNLLDPDYLDNALEISLEYPFLGAWGGQTIPEFEEDPPEWTKPYWIALAIKEFDEDKWSNLVNQYETTPCGAGMCIRKDVAQQYVEMIQHDPLRNTMDRKGNSLISYGDSDMAFTACDMGYGTGRFTDLKLKHLLPKERLEELYLLELVESSAYSGTIVESYRSKLSKLNKPWQRRIADLYRYFRMSNRQRRFYQAHNRGLKKARNLLLDNKNNK